MENITMHIAAPAMPITAGALALLCATPATDLRTSRVRSDVRFGIAPAAGIAQRVRVTAPTTGKGHVGTAHIAFGAGTVPGSRTWSPPI